MSWCWLVLLGPVVLCGVVLVAVWRGLGVCTVVRWAFVMALVAVAGVAF